MRAATQGMCHAVRIVECPTQTAEFEFVSTQIKALLVSGIPPSEIAVLYRTNALGKDIKGYMKKQHRDISCTIHRTAGNGEDDDSVGEYGRTVQLVCAYMQLAVDIYADEVCLVAMRTITGPNATGAVKQAVELAQEAVSKRGGSLFKTLSSSSSKAVTNWTKKITSLTELTKGEGGLSGPVNLKSKSVLGVYLIYQLYSSSSPTTCLPHLIIHLTHFLIHPHRVC